MLHITSKLCFIATFLIVHAQAKFHIQGVDMFIYLCTEFHMPTSNSSLVTVTRCKAKEIINHLTLYKRIT